MLKIATLGIEETREEFLSFLVGLFFYSFLTVIRYLIVAILPFEEGYLTGPSSIRQKLKLSGKFKTVQSVYQPQASLCPDKPSTASCLTYLQISEIILQRTFMAKLFQSRSQKPRVSCHLHSLSVKSKFLLLLHFGGIIWSLS